MGQAHRSNDREVAAEVKLAVVTPSCIGNQTRAELARKSLASLRTVVGEDYFHIVVDDVPNRKSKWCSTAENVYAWPNIQLVRRPEQRSNTSALRQAVREAREQGAELVFIHLDDNVYVPEFGALLKHARHAFERDEELMEVIFTGYPILHRKYSTPQLGNRSCIAVGKNRVSFGSLHLSPTRYRDYTLWWSRFHENMVDGAFWTIFMWQALYRAGFLEKVLAFEGVRGRRSLGRVEQYYKTKVNWRHALLYFFGKLGYINMQFGGLEMHRNKTWKKLICFPNVAVR